VIRVRADSTDDTVIPSASSPGSSSSSSNSHAARKRKHDDGDQVIADSVDSVRQIKRVRADGNDDTVIPSASSSPSSSNSHASHKRKRGDGDQVDASADNSDSTDNDSTDNDEDDAEDADQDFEDADESNHDVDADAVPLPTSRRKRKCGVMPGKVVVWGVDLMTGERDTTPPASSSSTPTTTTTTAAHRRRERHRAKSLAAAAAEQPSEPANAPVSPSPPAHRSDDEWKVVADKCRWLFDNIDNLSHPCHHQIVQACVEMAGDCLDIDPKQSSEACQSMMDELKTKDRVDGYQSVIWVNQNESRVVTRKSDDNYDYDVAHPAPLMSSPQLQSQRQLSATVPSNSSLLQSDRSMG